ncbi:hypothetical protein MLD38_014736 [Melastoma candidum]|uniref:Uncharacterized protein n=1 Tax=Melastoma candidum TaxID=119954 RepID=A0ACB9REB2_9MYRT|nr:hypothetical protein MLD38_014736 [Melastoma candidum]
MGGQVVIEFYLPECLWRSFSDANRSSVVQGREQFVDHRDTTILQDNKKPWVIFKVSHNDLRKNGEQWMKDTLNSCMLVTTLIATVVFTATFTVPGGNVDGVGISMFLNRGSFMVFAVSTTLALFSSVTAILMLLAILTSRYDPIDFLKSRPQKVNIGLASLFLSLALMMVLQRDPYIVLG